MEIIDIRIRSTELITVEPTSLFNNIKLSLFIISYIYSNWRQTNEGAHVCPCSVRIRLVVYQGHLFIKLTEKNCPFKRNEWCIRFLKKVLGRFCSDCHLGYEQDVSARCQLKGKTTYFCPIKGPIMRF